MADDGKCTPARICWLVTQIGCLALAGLCWPPGLRDEDADDALLDAGQKQEERLGAVDYDVWKCPGCGRHDFNRYPAWFTVYGQCPRCQYKTMNTNTTIVEQPTRHNTGQKRIDQQCQHCDYSHSEIMILPVLPEEKDNTSSSSSTRSSIGSNTSSSSDTTFGGGSSTGGGASGKW